MSSDQHNPFASSEPVMEPPRFVGRRGETQRIYTRIGAERPQTISIIGEKTIGKSSLLNVLAHSNTKVSLLSEPDRYPLGRICLRERYDRTPDLLFRTLTDILRETHADLPEASNYETFRALIQHLETFLETGSLEILPEWVR